MIRFARISHHGLPLAFRSVFMAALVRPTLRYVMSDARLILFRIRYEQVACQVDI